MPITSYASVLDPETMRIAQKAYDLAWAEISQVNGYDLQLAQNLLARRILEGIQKHGERDPERLKAYALERFDP
jgi:hypothetical protein